MEFRPHKRDVFDLGAIAASLMDYKDSRMKTIYRQFIEQSKYVNPHHPEKTVKSLSFSFRRGIAGG